MCQDWSWWLSDVVLQALFSLKKDHLRQKHENIKTSHCSQLLVFELSWHAFSVFRCLTSFLKKSGISPQRKTSEVGLRKPRDNFSGFRKLIQWIMIYTSKNSENSKRKGSSPASCPSEGSTGALLRKRRGALTISGPSVVPLQRVRAVMCMGGCCLEKWWGCHSVWWALHHFPSNRNDVHCFAVLFTALVWRFLRQALISKPSGTFDYHCLAAAGYCQGHQDRDQTLGHSVKTKLVRICKSKHHEKVCLVYVSGQESWIPHSPWFPLTRILKFDSTASGTFAIIESVAKYHMLHYATLLHFPWK